MFNQYYYRIFAQNIKCSNIIRLTDDMRTPNYDKYPSTKISGWIKQGWKEIIAFIESNIFQQGTLAIDCYTGVHEEEVYEALQELKPTLFINTRSLMKSESELRAMTQPFMTEDLLFGHITIFMLSDYFDLEKVAEARRQIERAKGKIVVFGTGATWVVKGVGTTIFLDMARWEIQQRFRTHSVKALGIDNHNEAPSLQYKRGYFNDWRILDRYKEDIFEQIDFWLDTHIIGDPKLIDKQTFLKGIEQTARQPFRVVPFFDPAPWGGQWMKEVCALDPSRKNYGWCFDCVPEENSLYLEIENIRFEIPSIDLILLKSREILGEPVEARFGKDFPIRFDFLDTVGGGNLSVQVHPTTQFIYKNFGINYTQDESYYLLDAKEGATVYLGLKNNIDKNAMIHDLEEAQKGYKDFDTEKYINRWPACKHDHFLIPGGTVHCSGSEALVLEISATPNLFTFKLWDWNRLGLDGKPRPINIQRGKQVIDWKRNTDYTQKNLINQVCLISSGEGWREERTGLHENEFIETRRHWFTQKVTHYTGGGVNVLNLIQGEEVLVESPTGAFSPFVVHYAETFIVPACVEVYTIRPYKTAEGTECGTIKAYVRFKE